MERSARIVGLAIVVLMGWLALGGQKSGAFPLRVNLLPALPDLTEPGMNGNRCNTCHIGGGGSPRNAFGLDWQRTWPNAEDLNLPPDEAFAPLAALDSDEDGFTNEQELLLGTHPGRSDSQPVRVRRQFVAGWNAFCLPVDLRRNVYGAELHTWLGDALLQYVWLDPTLGRFEPGPKELDIQLTSTTGLFVQVAQERTVEWVGRPWPDQEVRLQPGLQLIGWPTRPVGLNWLSDLVEPGELGIVLLDPAPRFGAFRPGLFTGQAPDAPLTPGKAILLYLRRERVLPLTGTLAPEERTLEGP